MSYQRLRYRAESAVAERISGLLESCGAMAVTIENAGEDAFYEAALPQAPDWQNLFVTGLFTDSHAVASVVDTVRQELGREIEHRIDGLEDRDWERAWLVNFRPVEVGADLWVCPGQEPPPDPLATNIFIDPGLAFGSGTHETTALCLSWLAQAELAGHRVCDYGCGSGILAVAALKLGAGFAWGVDVDPLALTASTANAERNGVAARYRACRPDQLGPDLQADLVLANILAEVIVELSDQLSAMVTPGGHLLLTGILNAQQDRVAARFSGSFELQRRYKGDWCLLIGIKR